MPTATSEIAVDGRPAAFLEAGRGRPLVLVHGAGGRGEIWTPQLDGLSVVAHVVAVDLPGHGRTAGPAPRTVSAYADWLVAFLDAAGLERVLLAGHSMGGAVAQTVALAQPERLDGLVLVGTGARLRVLQRLLELLQETPSQGRSLIHGLSYGPETSSARVEAADRALAETPPLVTLGDYVACDRFDMTPELGAIRAPTLVVVGRNDRLTPVKYARFLADAIPGARLVEIDAAGHFPQLEQPAAVNRALREFVESLE